MSLIGLMDDYFDRQLRKAGEHPEQILRRERDEVLARLAEVRSMARNSASGMVASSVLLDIVGDAS